MMLEGLAEILKSSSLSPVVFPAAFLLGLVGAVTSCCTLPVLGAIVGYSGTLADNGNRRALLRTALPFMLGTMGAFAALGAVSGLVGQVAGAALGFYWRLAAGFIMIFFGLASLNLLPVNLANLGLTGTTCRRRSSGATLYGLAVGGGRGRLFHPVQSRPAVGPGGYNGAGSRPLGRRPPRRVLAGL